MEYIFLSKAGFYVHGGNVERNQALIHFSVSPLKKNVVETPPSPTPGTLDPFLSTGFTSHYFTCNKTSMVETFLKPHKGCTDAHKPGSGKSGGAKALEQQLSQKLSMCFLWLPKAEIGILPISSHYMLFVFERIPSNCSKQQSHTLPQKTGSLLFLDPRAIEQCGSQLAIRRFLRTRIFGQALQRQSQWGRGLLNLSRLQCRRRGKCCGRRRRSGRRLRAKAGGRSALGHGSNGLWVGLGGWVFRRFWKNGISAFDANLGNVRDTIFYACGFSPFTAFAP